MVEETYAKEYGTDTIQIHKDAINENDSDGFGNRISTFINKISDYSRVKIVVSCRNEYYKERFRKYLVEKVNIPAFEFDLKEQRYTSTAINRIIKTYSNHFNYSGNISPAVKSVLSEQLLFTTNIFSKLIRIAMQMCFPFESMKYLHSILKN